MKGVQCKISTLQQQSSHKSRIMKRIIVALACLGLSYMSFGQSIQLLNKGTKTSIRGLSVVDDQTVWVSGSGGMVGRSTDGGQSWNWTTVKGFEKTEFRDIEAFDDKTAVIIAIDSPAYILRTVDAGENWNIVYQNHTKGMFLDAMEFWNDQSGIVIGDPINGRFFIARTFDGGKTWAELPEEYKPRAATGEACFASSGTNIRALTKSEAVFISGGMVTNLHIRNNSTPLPLLNGKESTGANSIAVKNSKTMMVVGGDFMIKDTTAGNCAMTRDAGSSWEIPAVAPHGYRSCVEYLGKKDWLTCGLNGVDYSYDDGETFSLISSEGFHVCRMAKKGKAVFLAGGNGKIGKFVRKSD